nr:MAG TPA: AT hook containing protein [Caudoviricetes sp.]
MRLFTCSHKINAARTQATKGNIKKRTKVTKRGRPPKVKYAAE